MNAIVIANWKMNGGLSNIDEFAEQWRAIALTDLDGVRTVVCPPYPYINVVADAMPTFELGAQDCSVNSYGAFTGEVAVEMLAEMHCGWVIIGHSERRQYHGESDVLVAKKACRVAAADMTAIVCVGESLDQRDAGNHKTGGGQHS